MKHKLTDIQHNKQYLEKKIQEYERKLLELRGGALGNSIEKTEKMNNYTNKLNTLSGAILDKVLSESRK
jgi:hypothetical protein